MAKNKGQSCFHKLFAKIKIGAGNNQQCFYLFTDGFTESSLLCAGFLQLWKVGAIPVAVCGLLTAVASLAEQDFWGMGPILVAHVFSCPAACAIFLEQGSNLCRLHWQLDS